MWNANLMQQGNFIDIFLARHVSGTATTHTLHIFSFFTAQKTICCNSTSNAPDDGRMYVHETCRAKNMSIKLPCCIKLAFHIS